MSLEVSGQGRDDQRMDLGRLQRGLVVQYRIVGAIMLRELHTRFGRQNIGYLWLIVEPMILSFGITLIHLFNHIQLPWGFDVATFYASGYITFIVYRNNVNRAAALIESNKPLLYHRNLTLTDLSLGRTLLEGIATLGAMTAMVMFFTIVGLTELPQRPWLVLAALALMTWFSGACAMIITAASEFSGLVERLVHPFNYLIMPVTGMFFVLDELPPSWAHAISWIIMPQITDLARMGFRAEFTSSYVNMPYIIGCLSALTAIGLAALRVARRHMHFE